MQLEGWHIVLIAMPALALVVAYIAVVVVRARLQAKGPAGRRPSKERRLNELDYLRKRGVISLDEYIRSRKDILRS